MRKLLGGIGIAAAVALAGGAAATDLVHTVDGTPVANTSEISVYTEEVAAQELAAKQQWELAYISSLETDVKNSLQEYLDDPTQFTVLIPIIVNNVMLIRTSDTTFEGTATMATTTGSARQIPIHVTADGRTFMWKTDPGALMPLFQ